MTAARITCLLVLLAAAMWSAAGLLDSLNQFGIGLAVAAAALLCYGLLDFLQSRRDEQIHRTRTEVWARRDNEQTQPW